MRGGNSKATTELLLQIQKMWRVSTVKQMAKKLGIAEPTIYSYVKKLEKIMSRRGMVFADYFPKKEKKVNPFEEAVKLFTKKI